MFHKVDNVLILITDNSEYYLKDSDNIDYDDKIERVMILIVIRMMKVAIITITILMAMRRQR